ncbi:StAR-related lipid transfer protein [Plasmodium chabaudi adami]|uniref:StAR-related lipid transfer protein n=1 Tax=Plasmodium chabaudi adami TaxID=5826 RepID=A0A1D3LE96_PLACE|nr:StAR-related lipid transfer protein [Plasmodium chabaudi adami]
MNFKHNKYYIFLVSLFVLAKYNNNVGSSKSTNLTSFKNVTNYRSLEELMDVENVKENQKYLEQAKLEEGELNVEANTEKESTQTLVKTKSEILTEEKIAINEKSVFINDELVTKYLNICDSVRNNTFSNENNEFFNKSEDCTLFKNPVDKNKPNYEIVGHGKLNDVSLYGMNYALRDLSAIREWNTHISYLNYLDLTKDGIEDKMKKNEPIDPSKHTIEDTEIFNNNSYLYLVNGLPWPFRSHDTPYEYYQKYFPDKNMLLVANRSVKKAFKDVSGYTRIRNYENFFCLYSKNKDIYTPGLDYVSSIFYDVNISAFLQNSILNQLFPKLIFDLNATSRKYTQAGLSMSEEEKTTYQLLLQGKTHNKKLKSVENKLNNSGNALEAAENSNILWTIFISPVYKVAEICIFVIKKTFGMFQYNE